MAMTCLEFIRTTKKYIFFVINIHSIDIMSTFKIWASYFFCCSRLDNINIHFTHATHQCVRCTHRELIIDDDKRSTTFENWRKHKTFMFFIENKLEERVQRLQLNFKVHFVSMLSSCFCEALKTQLYIFERD